MFPRRKLPSWRTGRAPYNWPVRFLFSRFDIRIHFNALKLMRRLQSLLWGTLAGLALFAWTSASARPTPVLDVPFSDPFVLPVGGELFAYATNGSHLHVPLSRSADGLNWSAPVDAMPQTPLWVRRENPDIWAPEVIRIGSRYVLYFTARHKSRMRPDGLTLCVGAAVADRPEGPFIPQAEPLTCGGEHGVIDASPFRNGDDLWLYFKMDGNCCGAKTDILVQKLSADGLALVGAPQPIGVSNDQAWEGRVVEAPQMVRQDGRYYLFYAANDYGDDRYATGYAVCETATGPCHKATENPILKSDGELIGPGHQSVFTFGGRTWIAFHGWREPSGKPRYRAMYTARLDWIDGRPVIVP